MRDSDSTQTTNGEKASLPVTVVSYAISAALVCSACALWMSALGWSLSVLTGASEWRGSPWWCVAAATHCIVIGVAVLITLVKRVAAR